MTQPNASHLCSHGSWKTFPKALAPFLALPPEIHLRIFACLNPIDRTCLSLTCSYIYALAPSFPYPTPAQPNPRPLSLTTGAPSSEHPVLQRRGCKHCVPVLYYPAHCELHFHIRAEVPGNLKFCSGPCGKFTRSLAERGRIVGAWGGDEGKGAKAETRDEDEEEDGDAGDVVEVYDENMDIDENEHDTTSSSLTAYQPRNFAHSPTSPHRSNLSSGTHLPQIQPSRSTLPFYDSRREICGTCGICYGRRYERGRRMLTMRCGVDDGIRVRKWYNSFNES